MIHSFIPSFISSSSIRPRVFNRRELSSLLSTIEGILDYYIAAHPGAPVPIFFADDAQALAGLLFGNVSADFSKCRFSHTPLFAAGHFQAKEADSGRERVRLLLLCSSCSCSYSPCCCSCRSLSSSYSPSRLLQRDAHEALRDFFAWAAAMTKAGKCHFIVASTPSFFFQALASGGVQLSVSLYIFIIKLYILLSSALHDDYVIPIELPELKRDDAIHYLVEHGIRRGHLHLHLPFHSFHFIFSLTWFFFSLQIVQ